jgi:dimethylglycine dehydrogenase
MLPSAFLWYQAMTALSVEKSYRLIGRERSIEYAALESGLSRFVHLYKGNFVERDGFENCFVTLEMVGIIDADARGSEPILANGCIVSRATNGGYGWRVGKSLAMAMVEPRFSVPGQELDIVIFGKSYRAVVIAESPFDPTIPD